jgi:hypothetical protein
MTIGALAILAVHWPQFAAGSGNPPANHAERGGKKEW